MTAPPPVGLLAELTHRCPLRCAYCSNPLELVRRGQELDTVTWRRVFAEAAELGCLQVHLSGGEPLARADILELVAAAREAGLYTNLITSGVTTRPTPTELAAAGLDHLQLSLQDAEATPADAMAGFDGAHARKLTFARAVQEADLPLTVNIVVHRRNLRRLEAMIALAATLGAARLEVAHVQHHGWALLNRDALLPDRAQVEKAERVVAAAREAWQRRMTIDHVVPDYHAVRPKPCLGGWGRQAIVVAPDGRILPCHAASSLSGLVVPNVAGSSLRAAWEESEAFARYRGTDWMPALCRTCPEAERDWGGCRCQAFALTGDAGATDPVCALSPHHALVSEAVGRSGSDVAIIPRGYGHAARV